jgi:hypothetical protein
LKKIKLSFSTKLILHPMTFFDTSTVECRPAVAVQPLRTYLCAGLPCFCLVFVATINHRRAIDCENSNTTVPVPLIDLSMIIG